ncbi:MAG: hypothetical protein KF754_02370 [Planctomycetes bacterium]|nr:hypothetical protein [Planctomycetota bacterium]
MDSTHTWMHHLSALAGQMATLDQGDAAALAKAQAELDTAFWTALQSLVAQAAVDPLGARLELAPQVRDLADFGALVDGLGSQPWRKQAFELGIEVVCDSLQRVWQDTLRAELVQRLEQQLDAIGRDLKEWPEMHLALIRHRDQLVLDALGDSPQAQHVLHLYSEVDERLEQFKRMERLHLNGGFRSNEERKAWLAIKGYVDERLAQVQPLLEPLAQREREVRASLNELEVEISGRHADLRAGQQDSRRAQEAVQAAYASGQQGEAVNELQRELARAMFYLERTQARLAEANTRAEALRAGFFAALASGQLPSAVEAVFDSVGRLQELHDSRRSLEQTMREERTAMAAVRAVDMRAALHDELAATRGLLRLAARYAGVHESPVETGIVERLSPAQIQAALQHVQDWDARLYLNAHARQQGRPGLLAAPGVGSGVYDRERNRFVLPLRCSGNAEAALAAAAARYRMEIDAAGDGELLRAYRHDIPENNRIRSNIKLREKFVSEYVDWITREAHGQPVLARQSRQWFEARIAPPGDEPWVPREFLDLAPRQLAGRLNELERAAPGPEREYRCGVLYWLLYPQDARAAREWALPRIERALELVPLQPAYLYSAAAIHRRLGSFQRALALFQRFAETSPPSWWTRKAVELCATCR